MSFQSVAPPSSWLQRKELYFSSLETSPYQILYVPMKMALILFYAHQCTQVAEVSPTPKRIAGASFAFIRSVGHTAQWIDFAADAGWVAMKKVSQIGLRVFGCLTGVIWHLWDGLTTLHEIYQLRGKKVPLEYRVMKWAQLFSDLFLWIQSLWDVAFLVGKVSLIGVSEVLFIAGTPFFLLKLTFSLQRRGGSNV